MVHHIDTATMAELEVARHLPERFEGEDTIDQVAADGLRTLQWHHQRHQGL